MRTAGQDGIVSEADIRRQVETFYARVRRDPELAPVFEAAIGPDWGAHLDVMTDFWSGVLRMTGRYKGKPLQVHRALPDLKPAHFERWLDLFRATAVETQGPVAAAVFVWRAERIAATLRRGVLSRDPLAAGRPVAREGT
ncbi:MAG: group III truncated hemoglobin [Kiloniellales bacterium]|nr:group III truncated hemoglobin [Kiloniellales bacterium]